MGLGLGFGKIFSSRLGFRILVYGGTQEKRLGLALQFRIRMRFKKTALDISVKK